MSSLEMANLIGKNILIVDEVDDTRTTLEYAVRELQKDVEIAQKQLGREGEKTNFFVFVLHVCVPPSHPSLSSSRESVGLISVLTIGIEQEQGEEGCAAR
jgi:hypoxanthine phosphoribosyltransferase